MNHVLPFVGFVYMLALISISNSHRDKIDVGNVEINIKEYPTYDTTRHAQLTVLAQNSDCWKVSSLFLAGVGK